VVRLPAGFQKLALEVAKRYLTGSSQHRKKYARDPAAARIAFNLLALFHSVTQRSPQERVVAWKQLLYAVSFALLTLDARDIVACGCVPLPAPSGAESSLLRPSDSLKSRLLASCRRLGASRALSNTHHGYAVHAVFLPLLRSAGRVVVRT
jgi:hypothetical protein